jgi:hypothetical protein
MSKILLFRDWQLCFLSDVIQTGLYELGHDIYESPILTSIRGFEDRGYLLPDRSLGLTGCPGYLLSAPLPACAHSEEEIRDTLASQEGFDLIILLSLREHSIAALNTFIPLVQDRKHLPIMVVDGEDYEGIDIDMLQEIIQPRAIFKRELKKHHTLTAYSEQMRTPVFPLPFASFSRSHNPTIDDTEKVWDLFLSLGYTHPSRATLVEEFLKFANTSPLTSADRSYIATNGNSPAFQSPYANQLRPLLSWPDYILQQACAKITAVMRGHGGDTMHAWEAFSFATAVLYCPTGNYIPHDFQNLRHCIHITEDCVTVPKVLDTLLHEDELRMRIAQAGKAQLLKHHTTKERARYLVEMAMGVLDGKKLEDLYGEAGL